MGVQPGYADAWMLYAELKAGIVDKISDIHDAVFLHQVACLAQGHMRRDVYDTQVLIGKKHGIFLGMGEGGIYLSMPVIVMSRQIEGLLVERCRNGAVHLICHGKVYGLPDRQEGSISALHSHFALLESGHVYTVKVYDVDDATLKTCLANLLDSPYLQRTVQLLGSVFHHGRIAGDKRPALFIRLIPLQRTDDNLRSYAGGVAHGDC